MNKKLKIFIIVIIAILAVVLFSIFILNKSNEKSNFENITNVESLTALVDQIYEGQIVEFPALATQEVDITDAGMVQLATGLDNASDLEYVVVSEPMMTSQAYSLVLVKVKDGANASEIAKKMNDNIDIRKWICVSAEKVYTTSSGNVICLVMSREELAKPVYEKFKQLAGTVSEEFTREEVVELPEDMY